MAKNSETPENKDNNKDNKKTNYERFMEVFEALQKSNENLKIVKQQFFLNDNHFISGTIKANDELLKTFEYEQSK